jgi:TolA-binding protein
MGIKTGNIKDNLTSIGFEDDLMTDCIDPVLFDTISEYMRGVIDLEDVKNDPALTNGRNIASDIISDYKKYPSANKENEEFIREIFSVSEEVIVSEIKTIKQEISDNKLNEITAEWVKEWHEKKQNPGIKDPKTVEISDFIKGSIESPGNEPVVKSNNLFKNGSGRNLLIKYSSLAAAALIGAFILIRTLSPSSDPEKLFNSYYKPFNAVSPVTRSLNINGGDNYSSAIENYRTGDYQKAAIMFASELQKDPSASAAQFYLGLSQLALNNYNQAINIFSEVVERSAEFGKEARWYMGLSYLKISNNKKAAECFEILARTEGYYHDRSELILRRLR